MKRVNSGFKRFFSGNNICWFFSQFSTNFNEILQMLLSSGEASRLFLDVVLWAVELSFFINFTCSIKRSFVQGYTARLR